MPPPSPSDIKRQIDNIVTFLVLTGLADDQQFALQRGGAIGVAEVTFGGAEHLTIALRDDVDYVDIYQRLAKDRAFNVKLADGALVQMMYEFSDGVLESHRLAFFPSPHLEEFKNNPDLYLNDEIYADVVARNIVPFPLRFDFVADYALHQPIVHPRAHLSLGQYQRCRIPVSAPLTPLQFVDFLLRNFYSTAFHHYADGLPAAGESFPESIHRLERSVIHVITPPRRGA